jgi:outer membrane protein assembly factor BamB
VLLDNGNMLLFDNNREGLRRSAVLEFDPLTGKVLWSYKERDPDVFFSKSCGSVQRLANGNTLITESDYGRAFELTPDKEIVWEYHNPYRAGEKNELVATLFEVVRLDPEVAKGWLPVE